VLIVRTNEVFPLLCPLCGGQRRLIEWMIEGADGEPDWDMTPEPAPDYEVDQRVNG
jgi:hypothetical protein